MNMLKAHFLKSKKWRVATALFLLSSAAEATSTGIAENIKKDELTTYGTSLFSSDTWLFHKRNKKHKELSVIRTTDIDGYSRLSIVRGQKVIFETSGMQVYLHGMCANEQGLIGGKFGGYHDGIGLPFEYGFMELQNGSIQTFALQTAVEDGFTAEEPATGTEDAETSLLAEVPTEKKAMLLNSNTHTTMLLSDLPTCDFASELEYERIVKAFKELFTVTYEGLNNDFGYGITDKKKSYTLPLKLQTIPASQNTKLEALLTDSDLHQDIQFEEQILKDRHRVVNLYAIEKHVFESFGLSLVLIDGSWSMFYQLTQGSKGTHWLTEMQENDEGKLQASICLHDCTWWGWDEIVEFDFSRMTIGVGLEDK